MATPVVSVAAGGIAVVEVPNGMAVTEAANARGLTVTKVVGKPYGMPVTFVSATGGPVTPAFAALDPATVTAVTISGGNLVATNTGTTSTSQGAHVASTSGISGPTGKYYCEFTITNFAGGAGVGVGVGITAATYAGMSTQATGGVMCFIVGHTGNGTIFIDTSGNTSLSLGAATTGDVICMAIDFTPTNRRVWFRKGAAGLWNGQSLGNQNPATGSGAGGGVNVIAGTIIPFVTFGSGPAGQAGVAGNVMTANFGASAFVGTPPSGFTAGWPA